VTAYNWIVRRERRRINQQSITTARLAALVMSGLSMGKSNPPPYEFLPFEIEDDDGLPRLSPAAAATIRRLIRDRTIPLPVIALIYPDLQRAG
jgi:hypothetical protein